MVADVPAFAMLISAVNRLAEPVFSRREGEFPS